MFQMESGSSWIEFESFCEESFGFATGWWAFLLFIYHWKLFSNVYRVLAAGTYLREIHERLHVYEQTLPLMSLPTVWK